MIELTRARNNNSWWTRKADGDIWMCHDTLKRKIKGIGDIIRDMRVEAYAEPTEDRFEVFITATGVARFVEFPHTYLCHAFERWLRDMHNRDLKYIQATYIDERDNG